MSLFSFGNKTPAPAPVATLSVGESVFATHRLDAVVETPSVVTTVEPDWSQLGDHGHNAFEVLAIGNGADFSAPRAPAVVEAPPAPAAPLLQILGEPATVTHNGRVRSGQRIQADGDLIVVGEVSSGAEIIAGGNLHVYGTCKGRVYAGQGDAATPGKAEAVLFILRCEAELVSINGNYMTFETVPETIANKAVLFGLDEANKLKALSMSAPAA